MSYDVVVAAPADAGIETGCMRRREVYGVVASPADAGIENCTLSLWTTRSTLHPPHMRGLKRNSTLGNGSKSQPCECGD